MLALGLPQTRSQNRDAVGAKEAALFRRRRAIAGMALTALCLCVLMTWRLFMQLPPSVTMSISSPRRTLHETISPHVKQQEKLEAEKKLADERQRNVQERQAQRGFHDDKRIVVVLTHFRDSDACAQTLVDAHATAFLSSRVHFRVFEELYLSEEQTCVQRYCERNPKDCKQLLRSGQLRTQRRDASGAVGATVAKYIAEGMVERKFADDFYLSVDPSVVVFTPNWDLNLLKQWHSVGNDMAILSVAPKSTELQGLTNSTVFVQCSARIHSKDPDAVVEFNAPEPIPRQGAVLLSPVLQTQYTEVFHFGPTRALFDVRSDPHTPLISLGQEYARATRFWTRGYDFYAPNEDVLFARYKWQEPPLPMSSGSLDDHTEQQRQRRVGESNRRIRRMFGLPVSVQDGQLEQPDEYGVGKNRSMEAWQRFSGVDPRAAYNESTTNQFTLCGAVASGQVHYVPY
ncbi:Glycosyltransferase, GlcNAc [Phytophthora cinnamomi]|uniref:Glycosyltransferase, GlcNAc n=1 Tax=Phytophthora cinnamomi TaxID=4785 RepID=UPI00355A61A3|nr:Glycosyltransferase, GlcNAc [Phytophthora cinnamomi]